MPVVPSSAAPRVLLADPDAFLLDLYAGYVSQQGFLVQTAQSGGECIRKLGEFVPDVLVLEPILPLDECDRVLAALRERDGLPPVPVIVVTYGNDRRVLYRIASLAVSDYRRKPLSAARLCDSIRAVVAARLQATGSVSCSLK
jgi:DNA-binding response OmpR family regulator